jgi:diacylglycerol kinase (ATP)
VAGVPSRTRSFTEAVRCACRGLALAARTQRHLRVQVILAAGALAFAATAGLPAVDLAVLALTAAVVLGAELLNTAVEMLTDLLHPQYSPAAAAVKDVSAGAALVAAAVSLGIAVLILLPRVLRLPGGAVQAVAAALALGCLVLLASGTAGRRPAG